MNAPSGDALDILANAVQRLEEIDKVKAPIAPSEHRVSCHRCGNIRKKKLCCPRPDCPHIFCGRCADKLRIEHGETIFENGCPVCKELCCCSNKTIYCDRKNHCYRKCPSTKAKFFPHQYTPDMVPPHSKSTNHAVYERAGQKGPTPDASWDQDTKNCRAPALDFLASIVTNTGSETDAYASNPSTTIGVGLGKVLDSGAPGIRKSDSTKSLASQSSVSSSVDSKRTPVDPEINSNGKRTPVESPSFEGQQKMLKVENGNTSVILPIPEEGNIVDNTAKGNFLSNLPMPNGQIPRLNNGQFNQNIGNSLSSTSGSISQSAYYFSDMKGSTQQQPLVYPLPELNKTLSVGETEM